ncbi:MAG TPA: hypothetical protein VJH68_04660 [Candidatus Nanoarchaeia archaeon]|nr:hypothetical protein [Candidatus Nanoarchaeia archaeon]
MKSSKTKKTKTYGGKKMFNYIKKGIIGLLLLLFVLSIVPSVLATKSRAEGLAQNEVTSASSAIIPEIREKLREQKEDLQEKSQERQEQIQVLRDRVKDATENSADARQKYSEAKERYAEAKEKYQSQREKLETLKSDAADCGQNCKDRKISLKRGTLRHLTKTIELLERSLETVLARLEHAPISDEEKESARETLLALEVKVTSQKEKILATKETATNEELREAIADLRSTWREVHQVQQRIISLLTQAKLSLLLEKHQEYLNGLDLRINTLKEKGIDVAGLEIIRNQFEKHILAFSLDFTKVNLIWDEAKSGRDVLNELHNGQQQLKNEIGETKRLLQEFLKMFKELNSPAVNASAVETK